MDRHGCPEQILTDNGKVFTGRLNHPPTEVLFDAICRRNGIEHLLTAPRSPTTTGKIERFHRTMRAELVTGTLFTDLATAQREVDAWVAHYNHDRPHYSLDMATPASRSITEQRREPVSVPDGPGRTGSRARSRPTGWSACPGSRSRSGFTAPESAATCSSGPTPCSSGSATSSCAPSPAPAPDPSATSDP
ncbi:transposase family protein [Actinotalea sp. BY-33]|uniref:Transposase family protein n=1 Tax=Actinotalea soli TaxID=2819234 RepID=A0A939LVR1_9CELL|nr:transposase family protein [Actinotalea soli]